MSMSKNEQVTRLSDIMPSTEEYMRMRMGTSGVELVLAAIEYVTFRQLMCH